MNALWWWIEVHTGTVNEPGPYYGFFSGFGSDIGELAILGGMIAFYRSHNCHEPRCWRFGQIMADGHTRSCWKHHPDGKRRPGHVMRSHIRYLNRTGGGGDA